MITSFLDNFFSGHHRSVKIKKNILSSFLLKGISIPITLLLVPLTIGYLNPTKYGVWLALMSIVSWFNFFDIGLGNGLRNKFASAKAEGKDDLARIYVSTTYAGLTLISIGLFIVFVIVNQFIDWSKVLNTTEDVEEIGRLVFVVFSAFLIQFVVKLINVIFIADQRPAMSNLINTLISLISLIVVFILTKVTEGSLFYLGVSLSIINLLVPFLSGIWFFNTTYKEYKPSLKFVDFSHFKEIMNLGLRFFIMTGAALIIYATDNVIITQISGPKEVTSYNIAHKYFGVMTMIFTIVTSSLWSAYTEAYVKKDFDWMKTSVKKVIVLWLGCSAIVGVMLLVCNQVYYLWVGPEVHIPFSLSLTMAIYVIMFTSIMVFGNFLSGVGKIYLSILHSIVVGIINIPLSIFFAKYMGMGSTGVILATCFGVFLSMLFQPIQCWKIINGKAKGIWDK